MFLKYAKQHLDKPEFFWRRMLMWINYNWGVFFFKSSLECLRRIHQFCKVSKESETKTSAGKSSKAFLTKFTMDCLEKQKPSFYTWGTWKTSKARKETWILGQQSFSIIIMINVSLPVTSGTSTSWSGDSPPSSLVFLFLLLRTLWMKFLWKSQM